METTLPHTPTPIEAIAASSTGALAGFESRCSCGLVMRNTIRVNVELDAREHVAYFAAKAARAARR
jgi:hypothetical protein